MKKPSVPKCLGGSQKIFLGCSTRLFSSFLRGASCPKSPRAPPLPATLFMRLTARYVKLEKLGPRVSFGQLRQPGIGLLLNGPVTLLAEILSKSLQRARSCRNSGREALPSENHPQSDVWSKRERRALSPPHSFRVHYHLSLLIPAINRGSSAFDRRAEDARHPKWQRSLQRIGAFLDEDLRPQLRIGCRHRHPYGISVRHQLGGVLTPYRRCHRPTACHGRHVFFLS